MIKAKGHIAISATEVSAVTLQILQHGGKDDYCKLATFNRVVDTKSSVIQIKILSVNVKPTMYENFRRKAHPDSDSLSNLSEGG